MRVTSLVERLTTLRLLDNFQGAATAGLEYEGYGLDDIWHVMMSILRRMIRSYSFCS